MDVALHYPDPDLRHIEGIGASPRFRAGNPAKGTRRAPLWLGAAKVGQDAWRHHARPGQEHLVGHRGFAGSSGQDTFRHAAVFNPRMGSRVADGLHGARLLLAKPKKMGEGEEAGAGT